MTDLFASPLWVWTYIGMHIHLCKDHSKLLFTPSVWQFIFFFYFLLIHTIFCKNSCDDKFILALPLGQYCLKVTQRLPAQVFFSPFPPYSHFSVLFQFLFFINPSSKTTDKTLRLDHLIIAESIVIQGVSCNTHLKFGCLKSLAFLTKYKSTVYSLST